MLIVSLLWWVVSAHRWFKGPVINITDDSAYATMQVKDDDNFLVMVGKMHPVVA